VRVFFDPDQIGYEDLLAVYWRQIDPTDREGQFVDRGAQYRPEIFVHSERQRELAEESKRSLAASGRFEEPIVVPITDAGAFYPAEEYHQDFYRTNPRRYEGYVDGSGRKDFLAEKWPGEETGGSR
jgi:methionine-S-sulfoxide reductase